MSRHVAAARLADFARGTLAGTRAQRVADHVARCPACHTALGRVRASHDGMRALLDCSDPELSPAAAARIEAAVRWARIAQAPRARRPYWMALVVTGCAAAALALVANRPWRAPTVPAPLVVRAPQPAPPVEPKLELLVTLLGGEVQLNRGGMSRRLDLATKLVAGDRLASAAGARVAAQWGEGSGFLLNGESELALARLDLRTQRLELERGWISVRVGPHDQAGLPLDPSGVGARRDESLQVITPDHIVSVHGTWFTVACAQRTTTVEVLEGTVEVTERDGSASTLLHAPARAVFSHGRTRSMALSGREASRLRTASEMNLQSWAGLAAARAATGELIVSSNPPASLVVDGVDLGATPLRVRRPLGRHYVELTRSHFVTSHQYVVVGAEPGEVSLTLPHALENSDTVPVEIETMVHARAHQIRACYERSLKRDPSLAGTVSLRLEVGDAGQVRKVGIDESTLSDGAVADCLVHEARGWAFAVGRNATVVYPFVFRPE